MTAANSHDAAVLTIRRAANLGTGLTMYVSIDGGKASQVGRGRDYSGTLSPGVHEVSVILMPNKMKLQPTKMTLTVQKGQSYSFTAMLKGNRLVLQ